MAILSFLGGVNIAVRQVTEAPDGKYPDAELLEVDAMPPGGSKAAVSSPNDLGHIRCVFNTMQGGKQGTVFIKSTDWWSDYDAPTYVPEWWSGDKVIKWFPEGIMEATKADELMKKAGYTQNYFNMTFRWPVYVGSKEEIYAFAMEDGHTFVLVGARTGTITVETH